jgi:poly(3-hydroxyalkanoate) synthetase
LLKLDGMMMTYAGKQNSKKRHKIMIDFLQNFFEEKNVSEKWYNMLNNFKKTNVKKKGNISIGHMMVDALTVWS